MMINSLWKKVKILSRTTSQKSDTITHFSYKNVAFKSFRKTIEFADNNLEKNLTNTPFVFKELPLDIFGGLLLNIPSQYKNLDALLPKMPSNEFQRRWNGSCGEDLLRQSTSFIKTLLLHIDFLRDSNVNNYVLDYGCGWGRLTRLLYKYVPPSNIWSLDPWDPSLETCRKCNIRSNLLKCDEIPTKLDVGEVKFNLIFAFSIFTHLSEKTSHTVINTLRNYIADDGILVITIRPPEFWSLPQQNRPDLIDIHHQYGFAFKPSNREPVEGEITYGDTSISIEYIRKNYSQWTIFDIDWNMSDPYQLIVFLKPSP